MIQAYEDDYKDYISFCYDKVERDDDEGILLKKDNKWGYLYKRRIVVPFEYDNIRCYKNFSPYPNGCIDRFIERIYVVGQGDLYGIIAPSSDPFLSIRIPCQYAGISIVPEFPSIAIVEMNGKKFFFDIEQHKERAERYIEITRVADSQRKLTKGIYYYCVENSASYYCAHGVVIDITSNTVVDYHTRFNDGSDRWADSRSGSFYRLINSV